jgi:hypothetical protein
LINEIIKMTIFNTGTSVYYGIHGFYWRTVQGTLVAVEGRFSREVTLKWATVWEQIRTKDVTSLVVLPSGQGVITLKLSSTEEVKEASREVVLP